MSMTQSDIERATRLERLPPTIQSSAHAAHDAAERAARARTERDRTDEQHPGFANPTTHQRVGHYVRLAIYPANCLAEVTAGAAGAKYVARTLLNLPDEYLWMAPPAFAILVLALELFVAHAREHGRDDLGRAPGSWTAFAVLIVFSLIGLQAISQITDTLRPLTPGGPVRTIADLAWFEFARVAFMCLVLGALHVAVLFGGRPSEDALAYMVFRVNRRAGGIRVRRNEAEERGRLRVLARLVTTYRADRQAHVARGLNPGSLAAFDGITLAMIERVEQASAAPASTSTSGEAASAAQSAAHGSAPPAAAPAPPNRSAAAVVPADVAPSAGAPPTDAGGNAAAGVEEENAYLRAILDAKQRDDDGEVRVPILRRS